jgi:hypothetical protein
MLSPAGIAPASLTGPDQQQGWLRNRKAAHRAVIAACPENSVGQARDTPADGRHPDDPNADRPEKAA